MKLLIFKRSDMCHFLECLLKLRTFKIPVAIKEEHNIIRSFPIIRLAPPTRNVSIIIIKQNIINIREKIFILLHSSLYSISFTNV